MDQDEAKRLKTGLVVIAGIILAGLIVFLIWTFVIKVNMEAGTPIEGSVNETVSGDEPLIVLGENERFVMTKAIKYSEQDVIESTTEYYYDDQGREYQSICTDMNGDVVKTEHVYDDTERSVILVNYGVDGKPYNVDKTIYNEKEQKINYIVYDEDGGVITTEDYAYDLNGRLIERTVHKTGMADYTEHINYDENGNPSTEGALINQDIEKSYDTKGRVISKKEVKDDVTFITEYSYFQDTKTRNMVFETYREVKDGQNTYIGQKSSAYDLSGNLLETSENNNRGETVYEEVHTYDAYYNETSSLLRVDGVTKNYTEYYYEVMEVYPK